MTILNISTRIQATGLIFALCFLVLEQLTIEAQASDLQNDAIATLSSQAYAGLEVIDLNEMSEMRGGFIFGGLEIKFGATLSTIIDSIRLETVFNITSRGAEITSQVLSNLAAVNTAIAILTQKFSPDLTTGSPTSTALKPAVTGPAADVTLATDTPSALQPSVGVKHSTVAPSSKLVSSAPPVIESPFAPAPRQANIATATAGPAPTAVISASQPNNIPAANTASVTTIVDNGIATNTTSATATHTNASVSATTIVADTTIPSRTPSTTTTSSTTVLVGSDTGVSLADVAPVDVNLDGFNNSSGFSGIAVSNNKGFTTALHRLTQDAAITAVISNASSLKVSHKLNIKIQILNAKSARMASMRAAMSKISRGFIR